MKKGLENKIMDRVYSVEAKRTGLSLLLKTVGIVLIGGIVLLFAQVIWEYVMEGQMIGMVMSLFEDREVFETHIGGVMRVLFDEIPGPLMIAVVVGIVICTLIVLTIVLNFEKIRNRIKAMALHWKGK